MRQQFAAAPEVDVDDAGATFLVHPLTGARALVPPGFVDLLPFARRPFTARDLVERSGAALSAAAVEHALAELRAIGLVVPAASVVARVERGAFHPLRWLAIPAVGFVVLAAAAIGAALQVAPSMEQARRG